MSEQGSGERHMVGSDMLSVWMDCFRWIAAFMVLLEHVRHRLFLPMSHMPAEAKTPLFYLIGGLSSFGTPAVIVFFVLSGYLVGGGTLRKYRQSGLFDLSDYILARLSRLWLVLIPVFCLTYGLNVVGAASWPAGRTLDQLDAATLLCNMAFLQTAACSQYGGNGALWSLFNEFWYYIAWPLVMLSLFSRRPVFWRAGTALAAVLLLGILTHFQMIGSNLALYFSLWLLGVIAADRSRPLLAMPIWLNTALLICSLMFWRIFTQDQLRFPNEAREFPLLLAIALSFTNLLMMMKTAPRLYYPPMKAWHTPLASFSFSLYCLHTPVINCLVALMMGSIGIGGDMIPTGLMPYLLFGSVVAICCFTAFLLSLVTERNTLTIRKAISRRAPHVRMA